MGGVRTLKWEGFGHWGGGKGFGHRRGKGWTEEKGGVCKLKGGGGIPIPWNVFEAPTRYV